MTRLTSASSWARLTRLLLCAMLALSACSRMGQGERDGGPEPQRDLGADGTPLPPPKR